MRTCQSCGKENPDDRDFCTCGEYLRWEPTGFVQAITPEMAAEAASLSAQAADAVKPPDPAPPTPPADADAPPEAGNGHHAPPPPSPSPAPTQSSLPAISKVQQKAPEPRPVAKTLVRGAVPPSQSAAAPEPGEPATIVLRAPDGDPAKGETLMTTVEPGQRERVLALVRNQSGIVDNYDLRIEGLPQEWWSIHPGTVYLVPFGSGGMYEQEVEVHLHPPRGPEAEARLWELKVVADSKANGNVAATAPLALQIEPYIETATTLRPQRRKGRRKANFDVTVANKANAPVLIALDGEDPDGELRFGFNRPPQEIPPGASVVTQMQVRPPRQIWIGRARDHRLEVKTITGEEAAERAAAEPLAADVLAQPQPQGKKRWFRRRSGPRVPGVYPPRVFKPQLYPPDVNVGPGGLNVRMPQFRGPQVQGPQMGSFNASQFAKPGQLKLPGRGGSAPPQAPLLPTQGVFRQKGWLPWWLLPLLLLLLLLLFLLLRTLPQNVVVPKVVGERSAFNAEKKLTVVDLKLDPNKDEKTDDRAPAGSILEQTPKPGEKVEKGTQVKVLLAVSTGKVNVPNIVGQSVADADSTLRGKNLTLGQASPPTADQTKDKIKSQIPAAGEVVKGGTPVNIFFADPTGDANGDGKPDKPGEKKGGTPPGGGGGGGEKGKAAAAEIFVPAVNKGEKVDAYAKRVADIGFVPSISKRFNDAPPGTLFGTDPPGGTKGKKGDALKLLVSAGQPQVVYTNGKNILRIDGRNGTKLDPVATSPEDEEDPTWAADGEHVAYTADGRVMLRDLTKKNSAAVPLTTAGREFGDLAWAPTADVNLIAMDETFRDDEDSITDTDFCLANVKNDSTDVSCKKEPSFSVTRHLHWAPNGRSVIGVGVKNPGGQGIFGIVRWKVKKDKPAFSPDLSDWSKGRFLTDIDVAGKGVLDAEVSPDGKRLALVSNQGSSAFQLWLADDPEDFAMSSATRTPVRACKVTWRPDSRELMVVTGDAKCAEDVQVIQRVDAGGTRTQKELNAAGDDPSFQPLTIGE